MRETKVRIYYDNAFSQSKEYFTQIANLVEDETIVILSDKCKDCVLLAQKDYSSLKCGNLDSQVVRDLLYYDEKGFTKILELYGFSAKYQVVNIDKSQLDCVNTFVSKFHNTGWEIILRQGKEFYLEASKTPCEKLEKFSKLRIEKVFL